MQMINVNKLPRPNYYGINVFNPTIVSHTFSLSSDDMLIYYEEIFRNRTNKNKPYIDRFNSIEELEEDIYGECHYYWLSYDFKEIYNRLDKQEFLKKINALIEEYGNAVITDDISLCIKTDESIRLKDWHNSISDEYTWKDTSTEWNK